MVVVSRRLGPCVSERLQRWGGGSKREGSRRGAAGRWRRQKLGGDTACVRRCASKGGFGVERLGVCGPGASSHLVCWAEAILGPKVAHDRPRLHQLQAVHLQERHLSEQALWLHGLHCAELSEQDLLPVQACSCQGVADPLSMSPHVEVTVDMHGRCMRMASLSCGSPWGVTHAGCGKVPLPPIIDAIGCVHAKDEGCVPRDSRQLDGGHRSRLVGGRTRAIRRRQQG